MKLDHFNGILIGVVVGQAFVTNHCSLLPLPILILGSFF